MLHLKSVDPCPVVAGVPDQVFIDVTADRHSYGGAKTVNTDSRGAWAAAVRFTDMSVNGPNPGLVPPKNPPQEPPPTDGTRYAVFSQCHSDFGPLGQASYRVGYFTYHVPGKARH